jgi:hypothetical protein
LTQSDPLTDEQVRKRIVGIEDVDQRGLVKRHRVLGQTIFDMLLIRELIDQSQHEAVHMFMEALSKSGAVVRSANLETEVFTPHRDVGNLIGERCMSFSRAYRSVISKCGEGGSVVLMSCFDELYSYTQSVDKLSRIAELIGPSLDALVIHYGTYRVNDPREIVREWINEKGGRG